MSRKDELAFMIVIPFVFGFVFWLDGMDLDIIVSSIMSWLIAVFLGWGIWGHDLRKLEQQKWEREELAREEQEKQEQEKLEKWKQNREQEDNQAREVYERFKREKEQEREKLEELKRKKRP